MRSGGMVRLGLGALVAMGLAGCESARFGGRPVVAAARPGPPPEPIVSQIPSGSVLAEPLPPPPGAAPPQPGPIVANAPPAALPPPEPPPVAPPVASAGASRAGSVGAWTATDATGSTCRINLSSTPALDLYRASASGCANKDLGRVTAWDFRDGEVYLYQPGGAVAARLRGQGASLAGVVAKSGAPLTLVR